MRKIENENGTAYLYPDGRVKCFIDHGGLDLTIVGFKYAPFPIIFKSSPKHQSIVSGSGNPGTGFGTDGDALQSIFFFVANSSSRFELVNSRRGARENDYVHLYAEGRWY